MAVRQPVYFDGSDIREMTTSQVNQIVSQVSYLYGTDPAVTLAPGTGGSAQAIYDGRLQAGASATNASTYVTAPSVTAVTTTFYTSAFTASPSTPSTTTGSGVSMPLYLDGNNDLRVMSEADYYDTFIEPAIDNLTSSSIGTEQAGTYHIYTSSGGYSGSSLVSSTPVLTDTRADAAAYTAAGIPETQDQPTTLTNYYLYRINASSFSYTMPLGLNSSNNLRTYATSDFENQLKSYVRYASIYRSGYRIGYQYYGILYDGSVVTGSDIGVTRGSLMLDTALNAETERYRLINVNDYRSQRHPSGTSYNYRAYQLRIYKAS